MDEGYRSRKNSPTPCGCSCGWFKTRLTQDQDLIVYQQPLRHVRGIPKTNEVKKTTVVSAIVIQNNDGNDVSVQTEAFLPEFDVNEINCPRCRHHIKRAKALLKDVFVAKNNNICVCEMCDLQRLAHVPCLHCKNVRKKLKLNDFFASRKKDLLIQQEQRFLKTVLGRDKKEKQTRYFRAYSDIHLTDTIERINKHSERVQRPKSALDSKYEPILKPESKQAIDHDYSKTSSRSRAKVFSPKNESLLGLGTTGLMRRFHSEESLRTFSTKEEKTFKYIFPRLMKDEQLFETSAEQLKDIRKRFPAESEEKIRELEKIKIKKDIRKMIEWAKQRGISLSDIDIKTRKAGEEIYGTKLEKIEDRQKNGIGFIDKKGRLIKKDNDFMRLDKKVELGLDQRGLLGKSRQSEKKYDKTLEEKVVKKKDHHESLKKIHDKKKTEKKLGGEDEKEKSREKGAKKKETYDKTKTGRIKERKEKLHESRDKPDVNKERSLKQKYRKLAEDKELVQTKGTENKPYKFKKDIGTADTRRGTRNIKKTADPSDTEKRQLVKVGKKHKQAPLKTDATKTSKGDENITSKEDKTQIEKETGKIKKDTATSDIKLKIEKLKEQKIKDKKDKTKLTVKKPEVTTIEKATEMQHEDSDLDISPESDAQSNKKERGKKTYEMIMTQALSEKKKKQEDEAGENYSVGLLNEVLKKQDTYIAVGKKAKKTKETLLRLHKEKAARTIAKHKESNLFDWEYHDPGANKVEKIVKKADNLKKSIGDKKTDTVTVPLQTDKVIQHADDDLMKKNIVNAKNVHTDDLIIKMIVGAKNVHKTQENKKQVEPIVLQPIRRKQRSVVTASEETDTDNHSLIREPSLTSKPVREIVYGTEIILAKDVPPEPEPESVPVLFHAKYNAANSDHTLGSPTDNKQSTGGPFIYALSDRKFIENGWTVLPTEKIVRKVNIYRMRPALPEFDWFERNKEKGTIYYSSGEKLAEMDENRRGRWYYKNGRLALDYYDCKEPNSQQRYVVYSSGEPDERGRSTPITVLGIFDFNGNGIVFDHGGKIRLKYNQNEGIVLDRSVGPVTHWKWHSLNDPPELQQVMIDSQLEFKDPKIFSHAKDHKARPQDDTLLALEYDNHIKSTAWKKEYKPNKINMKTMKMNDQFTLKILDQNRIYLLFRDGATTMKCNLGLNIDHNEIVDTTFCDVGEVCVTAEKLPAVTNSLADLQKCIKEAQKLNQVRVARELKKTPLPLILSADRMAAAASKPPRRPLLTEECVDRTPAPTILYYNTGLI
ncbi:hypothetical protein O0L34_g14864 [Tuta absoluta]|nr:hypothetical protein O0L34_g14864 [Tuta absoluta]